MFMFWNLLVLKIAFLLSIFLFLIIISLGSLTTCFCWKGFYLTHKYLWIWLNGITQSIVVKSFIRLHLRGVWFRWLICVIGHVWCWSCLIVCLHVQYSSVMVSTKGYSMWRVKLTLDPLHMSTVRLSWPTNLHICLNIVYLVEFHVFVA